MADALAAPSEPTAPATPPAPAITPEIEALIAQRVQALSDQRIAGLQSVFDKKLAEMSKEQSKLRRQLLPEEDITQEDDSDTARENAELKRQLALVELAQRFPKAGVVYKQLMGLGTLDEQVEFLEQQFAAQVPPAAPAPTPPAPTPDVDLDVPDIDMNRPAPRQDAGYIVHDGVRMTDEIAQQILASATSWPKYG